MKNHPLILTKGATYRSHIGSIGSSLREHSHDLRMTDGKEGAGSEDLGGVDQASLDRIRDMLTLLIGIPPGCWVCDSFNAVFDGITHDLADEINVSRVSMDATLQTPAHPTPEIFMAIEDVHLSFGGEIERSSVVDWAREIKESFSRGIEMHEASQDHQYSFDSPNVNPHDDHAVLRVSVPKASAFSHAAIASLSHAMIPEEMGVSLTDGPASASITFEDVLFTVPPSFLLNSSRISSSIAAMLRIPPPPPIPEYNPRARPEQPVLALCFLPRDDRVCARAARAARHNHASAVSVLSVSEDQDSLWSWFDFSTAHGEGLCQVAVIDWRDASKIGSKYRMASGSDVTGFIASVLEGGLDVWWRSAPAPPPEETPSKSGVWTAVASTWDDVVGAHRSLVVFKAKWCRLCDSIDEHVGGAATALDGSARVVFFDVSANDVPSEKINVQALPWRRGVPIVLIDEQLGELRTGVWAQGNGEDELVGFAKGGL